MAQRQTSNEPLVKLDLLTVKVFLRFIISMKRADGSKLTNSTYNGHRAALFNQFRDYKIPMPEDLKSELKIYFKGTNWLI